MQVVVADITEKRKKLPLFYKNAGSVFKNPEGDYAGRLIESVGLKGYTVGDAKVSEEHANFIVNVGNMTSKDVKKLIEIIKDKVYNEYKIELTNVGKIVEKKKNKNKSNYCNVAFNLLIWNINLYFYK